MIENNGKKEVHWLWRLTTIMLGVIISLVSFLYVFTYSILQDADAKQISQIENEAKIRDAADKVFQTQIIGMDKNITLICKTVVGAKCDN